MITGNSAELWDLNYYYLHHTTRVLMCPRVQQTECRRCSSHSAARLAVTLPLQTEFLVLVASAGTTTASTLKLATLWTNVRPAQHSTQISTGINWLHGQRQQCHVCRVTGNVHEFSQQWGMFVNCYIWLLYFTYLQTVNYTCLLYTSELPTILRV